MMRGFGLGPDAVRVRLSDRRVLTAYLQRERQFEGDRLALGFAVLDKIDRTPREKTIALLEQQQFSGEAIDRLLSVPTLNSLEMLDAALGDCPNGPEALAGLTADDHGTRRHGSRASSSMST